jgi:predicted peptidase
MKYVVGRFTKPDIREKFPCFVLAPQTSGAWIGVPIPCEKPIPAPKEIPKPIAMALEVLNAVVKAYSVDTQRVYLSGASNGACAVWCLLEHDPRPWAAAVPIAGAGDPRMIAGAHRLPIWILHGDKDTTILPERSREMIAALKAAGGTPKYTEVRGGSHGAVIKKGFTEDDLLPWMFEQKRKGAK